MHINLVIVFLFLFCKYVVSESCGNDILVSSTVTAYEEINSLCDVCLKYKFNGNNGDSNSKLSISCTLPGKLSCYETTVLTQYEIENNYHNCSIQIQTIFGDEPTTTEYLNTEYPIGSSLIICATDDNSCYVPSSSATMVRISTIIVFSVVLINIIMVNNV